MWILRKSDFDFHFEICSFFCYSSLISLANCLSVAMQTHVSLARRVFFFLVCKSCGFSAAKSSLPEIIAELRKKAHSVFLHTIPSTEHFSSPSGGTPNWVCICAWNVCVLSINPKKKQPPLAFSQFVPSLFHPIACTSIYDFASSFRKKRKSFLFCVKKINKTIKP